jgi:hypothetical protein
MDPDHRRMMVRLFPTILIPIVLSLLPFVLHLWSGSIVGAGPDVVSTLWGMWWFQQEGVTAVLGTQSTVLNYPFGATGVVLSPSSAIIWALLEPFLGVGTALVLSSWIQIAMMSLGCGLLASRLQISWLFASVVPLIGTYLFFGVGEGSLVAIACAPLVFGLYCLLQLQTGQWRFAFGVGLCMIWMALENPYLAPFLPVCTVLFWFFVPRVRSQYTLALLIGCIGVLYIAAIFGAAANPDYPREIAGKEVRLFGRAWQIVELPWSRMQVQEFWWPRTVRWTTGALDATQAVGGRYLGFSVLLLTLYGVWKKREARIWMAFALLGIFLSMGSLVSGMAFPFLFLNHIMDALARPLTQPTRYLCLAVIGFSICVSYAVTEFSIRKRAVVMGILLLDSLLFGSLSLSIPSTKLPKISCSIDGPILLYPWDARDGELSTAQLYQIVHEQPAAHTGIASWALPEGKRALDKVRGAGFSEGSSMIRFSQLYRLGYRWVLSEEKLRGRGASVERCGEHWLYRLNP